MQIAPHLPKIIYLISTNDTVSIVAPTGSGKSVGVPAAIASAGARCFVTVPTRTAAVSLAEYQRILQRNMSPGLNDSDINKLVGFAAEGNINYGNETMISYVTGGHARRKMLSYFSGGKASPIDFCDVLMVDEVHSGSLDTTIIISLWMYAAASQVRVPRLVIASATPVPMIIEPTPAVYTVDLESFPIEYKYLTKRIDIDDATGSVYFEAAKIAANIHVSTDVDTGHILIFAPGSSEVENIASTLTKILDETPQDGRTAEIIPAFGALRPEDIAMIYKQTAPNERKIVIATNIAEMSITISDVGHVIDTMVEKRAEMSQSGGFRLTTHYISKDSARQRAGRTGRTRPGICYRLCTEEQFDKLEDHRPPEIDRVPIYEIVMELLDVGLYPETVIKGVDVSRISRSLNLLIRLGMVIENPEGLVVTDIGHFAPKFHVSVRNAAFLWHWIQNKYPIFPGIVAACLIDSYGPSYFWIPRKKPEISFDEHNTIIRQYKEKYFGKYIGYNDLESCLNMWNDLMTIGGGIHPPQRALINWSRDNSINNKKIRELLKIVEQSVNASNRLGYPVEIGPFTTNGVMTAARPILLSVYSVLTMIHKRDTTYTNPITREDYRLDNRDSLNQFSSNPPKGIIALVTAEIKTKSGKLRIIGFGVDTDIDGLGRPIVVKDFPQQQRGPRTITRKPFPNAIPPNVTQATDINDALGLLAGLNLGTPQQTEINNALELLEGLNLGKPQETDINDAFGLNLETYQGQTPTPFDLLNTLTPILTNIQPPVVVLPPNILHSPKTLDVPSPTEDIQNTDAAMDLLAMLDLTTPTAQNIITIVPIDKATDEQLDALSVIGTDERIYKHLGMGNPWDRKHVGQLRQFAIDDKLQGNKDYLHWIVLLDNIVVGYVGIHPTGSPAFPGSQLRSFVAPAYMNRGIATTAKLLMIQGLESPTTLRSFIDPTNLPSIRVAEKTGFTFSGQARIGKSLVNVYSRSI